MSCIDLILHPRAKQAKYAETLAAAKGPRVTHRKRGSNNLPEPNMDELETSADASEERALENSAYGEQGDVVGDWVESNGAGATLLQDALSRAENVFEDKQTTRLVRDEYDMVAGADADDDDFGGGGGHSGRGSSESVDDDDGFEML